MAKTKSGASSATIKKNGEVLTGEVEESAQTLSITRESIPLFSKPESGTWRDFLVKAKDKAPAASNQDVMVGERPHPFNMEAAEKLLTANPHHSACIAAKVSATVGLGLVSEADEDKLDELCAVSWQTTVNEVAEDYETVGNGYFEVVRDESGAISGLHHIKASSVYVHVDSADDKDFHYIVRGREGVGDQHFARFGMLDSLEVAVLGETSEVIHLREPNSPSKWYGVPEWLSCVPAIELVMSAMQHNYDFFNNRGVPEFILSVTGTKVSAKEWAKIEDKLLEHVGSGNSHKSLCINLPGEEARVQIDKLAMESQDEGSFEKLIDSCAMLIVSGHQVPPQLAGIMIPGKLGATNELPNAMATFQTLVCGQKQKLWSSVLGCTLGKDGIGVDGVSKRAFKWKKITDEINLPALEATARTRKPLGEGESEEGVGPQGGDGEPDAGTPAARLADMQKSKDPVKAVHHLFDELMKSAVGLRG